MRSVGLVAAALWTSLCRCRDLPLEHDLVLGEVHRIRETPKVRARCSSVRLSALGNDLRAANRSIIITVQTVTSTKSNICEGSRTDWREGLGQCLARLTNLNVFVRNFDGSCADCQKGKRTNCSLVMDRPAGLVVVIGGGDDDRNTFRCVGSYCGEPHKPISFSRRGLPSDYVGACVVRAVGRFGAPVFDGAHVEAGGPSPTRFAWFPIVSPLAGIRSVIELASLYAGGGELPRAVRTLHLREEALNPRGPVVGDYDYLKTVVEPALAMDGPTLQQIQIFRDDSYAKPLLMPLREMRLYLEAGRVSELAKAREKFFLYIGSFRENKGQLNFLQKLRPESLGAYAIHFYGRCQEGHEAHCVNVTAAAARFGDKVVLEKTYLPHEALMRVMSTASGMIHYSWADRNPRVFYEALHFGLPLFISTQSMPYIGLQCTPFVYLSDYDSDAGTLHRDMANFVAFVSKPRDEDNIDDAPAAVIRRWVDRELAAQNVFASICARLGVCAS